MHKFNYNYKITNTKTGEFYIGVRSCDCEIELDSYMGSSSVWTKLYIKENKDFLKKEIVATFSTRKEANKGEVILLQKYKDNPLCINCYFDYTPDVTGTKQTPEWIEKRKMFGEKNGMFGKHHTEETKKKISDKLKGRKLSEETKKKIGDIHRGKVVSQETREKQSKARRFVRKIENIITGEIVYMTLQDFCELHPEVKVDAMKKACNKGNICHKTYKITNICEASTSDSSCKLGENGEPLEVDNPVGRIGNE